MRLGNMILCFAVMAAVTFASSNAADNPLRIEVSPRISSAPTVFGIRAIVTPDAANRALHIVVDSGSYYRSSMVPLDGANAAVTDTTLKNIPGGDYEDRGPRRCGWSCPHGRSTRGHSGVDNRRGARSFKLRLYSLFTSV